MDDEDGYGSGFYSEDEYHEDDFDPELPDDYHDDQPDDRLYIVCIQADDVVIEMNKEIEKARGVIEASNSKYSKLCYISDLIQFKWEQYENVSSRYPFKAQK